MPTLHLNENGPGWGHFLAKRVVVGLASLLFQMNPGRQKGEVPAFARREPTKIAARQRGAMSSVGG